MQAYVCMLSAIVLRERANGVATTEIEGRWGVAGLSGIEETWRDTTLWLLSGLIGLFDIRAFYHHLLEHCGLEPDQIKQMKYTFGEVKGQGYEMMERVKHCSALGGLLRGLRNLYANREDQTVGIRTIRRLESAGILTIQDLNSLKLDDLIAVGVKRQFAIQIRRYLERRQR